MSRQACCAVIAAIGAGVERRPEMMAAQLVHYISPSILFSGKDAFVYAIEASFKTLDSTVGNEKILLTKWVYPEAGKKLGRSGKTASRAVYRAANYCWMDGRNRRLNEIIGFRLPRRPTPGEIVLYCAYYLKYGVPFHRQWQDDSAPALLENGSLEQGS